MDVRVTTTPTAAVRDAGGRASAWRRTRQLHGLRSTPRRRSSSWPSSSSCRCSSSAGCRPATGRCCAATGASTSPTTTRRSTPTRLFWPAVVFTIEYTVLVTVLLIGLGLGLALLVQEGGRWVGFLRTSLPAARGGRAWRRRRCCSGASTRRRSGRSARCSRQLGLIDEPISFLGTPLSALLSTTFLIVWKYAGLLHADPARRAPGDPRRGLRGGRDRRRRAAGRPSAGSRCRSCVRRSRWR